MSIKVFISRRITKDQEAAAKPVMQELHALAWRTRGYVSGEALINVEAEDDQVVVSSWQSMKDWEHYRDLEETKQLHFKLDQILGRESSYTVYRNK